MKKSNKRLSRFLSFLMALITLFSALPLEQVQAAQTVKPKLTMEMPVNDMIPITPKGVTRFSTFNSPVTYYENQKLQIENVAGKGLLISVGGANDTANFAPSQVTWTNPDTGQVYQAYCVNAAYSGYGDVANYDITVMEFGDTVQFSGGGSNGSGHAAGDSARGSSNSYKEALWGAVSYGYPSRTAEEVLGGTAASFGVSQEVLEYSAYAATKFAIWAIVHNNYTLDKWSTAASGSYPQTLKTATLNAQKAIYNYALNFQGITVADVSFSASKPEADPINKVYEITYTISSENIVPNTDMYLRMDESYSPFPAEMTITDMSGNSFATGSDSTKPQYIIPAGITEFKVTVPIPPEEEYSETYSLMIYAQIPVKTLVFGRANTSNVQDYILAGNGFANPSASFTIKNSADNTDPPPTETDPPTETTPPSSSSSLKVLKLDAKDNMTPLQGATFDLYNSNGQLVDTGTTNSSGTWIPNIKETGTYTIIERSTNPDYQLTEPTSIVITVLPDRVTTATFRNFKKQTITVYKEDAITGEPIEGVQYEIYQIDGKGAWRAVAQTDSKGRIVFEDVPDGTYLVREVSTIGDYILDPTPQYVTVRNGQAPSLKFLNSKHPSLNISKLDRQTGASITAPATFLVEQIDGSFSEYVTTTNGIVSLKDLPVGSYKITEVSAPNGYVMDSEPVTVYLAKGESRTTYLYNLKAPVLTIEKIDAQTGTPIPGTKFQIKKSDGTIIGTVTTGADGKVTVGLEVGELGFLDPDVYTVTEVSVPEPYELSNEHQDIRLEGGDTKTLFFGNLEMPRIIVEKYDEQTGEKLPNAQFAIYSQHDLSRPVIEGMTDEKGQLNSGYIKPGTYVVKEINPPFGYMISDKTEPTRTIVAQAGDGDIIVKVDNIKLPELTIRKIDSITKQPIEGVTYSVRKVDDESVQPSTATTDSNGLIVIPNLEAGAYEVTEISAPSKYILNPTPQYVKLNGGEVKTLLFENTLYPTLVIYKWNAETYKGVANTTFLVERENSDGTKSTIGTHKTNADGYIVLPYVETGYYVFTETIPAQGMQLPTNPVKRIYLAAGTNSYTDYSGGNTGGNDNVEVTSGLDYPVIGDVVNYPLNALVIKKSDANTGEMLAGATFEVIKVTGETSGQNGTLVRTVTTNISGVIVVTGLEAGAYTVREIQPPTNYMLAETNMQSVNLKADGTSVVEVLFNNLPYGHILISKVDALTNKPLSGARFKVVDGAGTAVGNSNGEYVSDENGEILISNVEPKSYVITEIEAPENYAINTTPQTVQVGTDGGTYKVSFANQPYGTIVIKKYDFKTHEPLANAIFKVTTSSGDVFGNSNGLYTTNATGTVTIPNVSKGSYIVSETVAPDGYVLENQTTVVDVEYGKTHSLDFYNKQKSGLQIIKIDSATKEHLKGAKFTIYKMNGEILGHYETNGEGIIIIDELEPNWYKIVETKSPDGYLLDDTPVDVEVTDNEFHKIVFENKKLTSLTIQKEDDKSGEPLAGAQFSITKQNGEIVGTYTTGKDGTINIPTLDPDWYIVSEKRAPDGYLLDETPKTVEVKTNVPTVVIFTNKKLTSLEIFKKDEATGEPIAGTTFIVEKQNGERIGEYITNESGVISIPTLDPDWYVVRETRASDGYLLDDSPRTVQVKTDSPAVVNVTNKKLASLIIKKVDEITGAPLAGAQFKVTKSNGEIIGEEYVTGIDGVIQIPHLDPDHYVISETKSPSGYILDNSPKTVEIKTNTPLTVTFSNKPMSGLKILKLDSVTREPLAGVEFAVAKMNGERIGNFKTDSIGQIYIENLGDGYYTVTEIKSLEGYHNDPEPKTVQVKWGEPTLLEITNDPYPALVIYKTSSEDKKPIAGVKFLVTKENGEQIGYFTTDKGGRIFVEGLSEGKYIVRETEAASGFLLDETPHEVDIKFGKRVVLEITNKPMASILIHKIDSVTKEGIYGVKFLLYDEKDNPIGQFVSDDQGYVWLDKELPAGKYKLRELEAADGYILDEVPRTIYLGEGQTTHIKWENTARKGQIVIAKRSADFNEVTGLAAGSPLAGATFEIYNTTGNMVDKITSDERGIAGSKLLPIGIYFIKEVSAPRYYAVNSKELWAEIKHDGDIVRFEVLNQSVTLDLSIYKKAASSITAGDNLYYELTGIANNSSVGLENFYIHDRIPTDATRVLKVMTGTYNERVTYQLTYKTNYHDYRVLAENLLSKNNYEYSLHPNALGLAAGEFVTDVRLEFPKVSSGFKSIENVMIVCQVMPTVPKDYKVVNRADIGGRIGNEWESATTSWTTTVYINNNTPTEALPKTGY